MQGVEGVHRSIHEVILRVVSDSIGSDKSEDFVASALDAIFVPEIISHKPAVKTLHISISKKTKRVMVLQQPMIGTVFEMHVMGLHELLVIEHWRSLTAKFFHAVSDSAGEGGDEALVEGGEVGVHIGHDEELAPPGRKFISHSAEVLVQKCTRQIGSVLGWDDTM